MNDTPDTPQKTPMAARTMGVTATQLASLIRYGRLTPPRKDSSGDYIWTQADRDRAWQVLTEGRRQRVRRAGK